jgi:hypothetical protein
MTKAGLCDAVRHSGHGSSMETGALHGIAFLSEIATWALDRPNSRAITHALSRGALGRLDEIRSTRFRLPEQAQIAQLVEQRTENPRVGGSNPPLGTILFLNKINNLWYCHSGILDSCGRRARWLWGLEGANLKLPTCCCTQSLLGHDHQSRLGYVNGRGMCEPGSGRRSVMHARQNGALQAALEVANDPQYASSKNGFRAIMMMAYDMPRFDAEEHKQAIDDFRDQVQLSCMKGGN